MNILMQEINKSMYDLSESPEGNITARFIFPSDFSGFKGHFPGRPVLPGVCKIQAVIAMLEKWHEKNVCLTEISMAKFFAPVCDNQEIMISSGKIDKVSDEPKQRAHSPLLVAGLASELKTDLIPCGRRFPAACGGELQSKIKASVTSGGKKIAELQLKLMVS